MSKTYEQRYDNKRISLGIAMGGVFNLIIAGMLMMLGRNDIHIFVIVGLSLTFIGIGFWTYNYNEGVKIVKRVRLE